MRIINLMLGKGRGGLEQAAIDYHEALSMAGHDVLSVVHPKAAILGDIASLKGTVKPLKNGWEWNPLAAYSLARMAKEFSADLLICHGNRAIGIALKALKNKRPIIGVAHNYQIKKRFPKLDGVFCITQDLLEEMVHLDIPRSRLFHIPNMIRLMEVPPPRPFHSPPVIATMGRFVEKKGFDIFIRALKGLDEYQVDFKAKIGGDGALTSSLVTLKKELGLSEKIEFCGWVKNKESFFAEADIFVLPSQHEPFGIVLIEAMAAGLPCVTTDTEGPCEIIEQHKTALMVDKARPYHMAQALRELIEHPEFAQQIGLAARQHVAETYAIEIVSKKIDAAIQRFMTLEELSLCPT